VLSVSIDDLAAGADCALRRLFDASADFVMLAPIGGRPRYLNPAGRRALGIGPSETIETLLEFRPPGFERYLREFILAAVKRDGIWRGETEFVTRGGDAIRVTQSLVAETMADGVECLLGVARELSAAEQQVATLRKAEERTRFALEAAHAGVWEADLRSRRVTWSDSMRAVQGFSSEEFSGTLTSFLLLVHPNDRDRVTALLDPDQNQPQDFATEFRVLWPDGTTHWVEAHGRVLRDETGRPARVLAMAQDVTARRTLEEQVHQAQKIEAVGQLAGGLAHDFNNLLTVILGYGRLLEADLAEDDARRQDATEVVRAGERAAELTRQLLAFGRRQVLQPAVIDLNALIADLHRMLARLIGEHIQVDLKLSDDAGPIRADPGQIEQVIVNLAVNARDAMPRGGTLTIATSAVDVESPAGRGLDVAPGPHVLLSIADTGVGMTDATRRRIFEPFFTTKERGKGTGLGLASVFGIVKQSDGAIQVTSAPGSGSQFDLYFPAALGAPEVAGPAGLSRRAPGGSETIMLVEDEAAVRALAQTILSRSGYTVLAAASADDAARLAAEHPPVDLLLTDVVMPGASGPTIHRRLSERQAGLRVLYMSGFAEEAIAEHGIVRSGVPFLPKPFTAPDLTRAVRAAIDGPEPAAAGPASV
jgi:PAS domain S-box-containing protein